MPVHKFTIAEVPGAVRGTDHRNYTHAVVGRRSGPHSAAAWAEDLRVNERKYRKWDIAHWDNEKRASVAVIGQLYKNHNGFMVVARDYEVKIGLEFIAKHPDREVYLDQQTARRQARIKEISGEGEGELGVLRWSMSLKAAEKAANAFRDTFIDVRVVDTIRIK